MVVPRGVEPRCSASQADALPLKLWHEMVGGEGVEPSWLAYRARILTII